MRELIFAGVAAMQGESLDAAETEQADALAKVQEDYLDQFERQLAANPPRDIAEPASLPLAGMPAPMSPAQFAARAEMYGTAAWQAAQKIQRSSKRRSSGGRWERRILGHPKTEHCTDCPPLAALGWQPIGTLPDIGDSECGGLCLCHFEYSAETEVPSPKVVKPPPTKRRPKIVIDIPDMEHPEGPLSKEQLDEIMSKMTYSAKVVMGR